MEQCLQKHLSLPAPAPLFHARKTDPLFQELKVLNLDTVASTPTDKKKKGETKKAATVKDYGKFFKDYKETEW